MRRAYEQIFALVRNQPGSKCYGFRSRVLMNLNSDKSLFRTRTLTARDNFWVRDLCDIRHRNVPNTAVRTTGNGVAAMRWRMFACAHTYVDVTLSLRDQHRGTWDETGQSGAFATRDGGWGAGFDRIQVGAQRMARHTGYCFQCQYPFSWDTFAPPLVDSLRGNPQSLSQGTKPTSQTDNSIQWFFRHAHKSTTG